MNNERSYDLIIAGGGLTGCAAAIAAGRRGKKALIIEPYGFLGGAIGHSYVNPFMCHTIVKKSGERVVVNAGIFAELLEGLEEMGALMENRRTFNEEMLKCLLDRLTREAGVDVLFHSRVTGIVGDKGKIDSVEVETKAGKWQLHADYFLDATGDADLAAMAGCPFHLGRETDSQCQPMTLCFRIGNVDTSGDFWKHWGGVGDLYKQYQKEGKIKNPREDILMFRHVSEGVIHMNSTRILRKSPVDPWEFSEAEREGREQMLELYHFMKEHAKGFENSVLLSSAPQIGVRESRMIDGEYTITVDDILSCRRFDDSIACGAYGVDIHSPDGSGTDLRSLQGDYYTLPYRALIPKGWTNLLVAGRCISSTHEAQSAYRVLPICCCLGEGAGLALTLAHDNGCDVREISMDQLHQYLDENGAKYW